MSLRCTEEEIKAIIDTTLENEQVVRFHQAASTLIDSTLTAEGYSADLLKEIEIWLSAHFLAARDPRVRKEKFGDANATYQGKDGMGLKSSDYGQRVLLLDFNGVLAAIDESKGLADLKVIDWIDA